MSTLDVSVVMPCLDEAEAIESCVSIARSTLLDAGLFGEVIVVDNGSCDGSGELAARAGARVVSEPCRGYGRAYLAGLAAARGRSIVMADADLSYDLREVPRFVAELDRGADLVMGDRRGNIEAGAMPWHHRYFGNPVMTWLLNTLFRTRIGDAWCGLRAVRRDALPQLALRAGGMEFALEMIVRASRCDLRVAELSVGLTLRTGESKLSSFRDGLRALRFLLLHGPVLGFTLLGAGLCILGSAIFATSSGPVLFAAGGAILGAGVPLLALGAGAGARLYTGRPSRAAPPALEAPDLRAPSTVEPPETELAGAVSRP